MKVSDSTSQEELTMIVAELLGLHPSQVQLDADTLQRIAAIKKGKEEVYSIIGEFFERLRQNKSKDTKEN